MEVHWGLAREDWLSKLATCPGATYFHTPMWLEGVVAAFGGETLGVEFRFPDGNWALIPMTLKAFAKGLLSQAYSGESGVYGGPVSPWPLSPAQLTAISAFLATKAPNLQIFGNPFTHAHLPPLAGWETLEHATHVLDLVPGSPLRLSLNRGCRARGNKARRAGITTEVYRAPDAAEVFYRLYVDSLRRWGEKVTWIRPLRFYEAVLGAGDPHVSLHLARHEDRPAAVMIVCAWGDGAHYLAGAADSALMEHCPSNLLMEDAAAVWHARGKRFLDLGSSNGLAGVAQFKESFGARTIAYSEIRHQGSLGRLYFSLHRPYRRFAQSMAQVFNL